MQEVKNMDRKSRETNFMKTSEPRKMLGTKLKRKSEWKKVR